MNRTISRLGLTGLALVAGATVMYAQETGTLVVTVKDQAGKPVEGATLSASSPTQIGGARVVKTDAQGRARFGLLYPGDFTVQVSASGFNAATMRNLRVGISSTATAEVKLAPISQVVVEVVSSSAAVDPVAATTATRLGLDTVDSLPTARTYTDYIKLVPGVIASPDSGRDPVVAGSVGRDNTGVGGAKNNTYILDGMDSTDPYTGKAGQKFNSEIIQEQEIKTGGITAEVAARGGGLVSNVVTKSGSNNWSGSLNYYFQNASLRSSNKPHVKTVVRDFSTYDAAFTFGGPIIKDRLWFFSSVQLINQETKGDYNPTAVTTPTAKNTKSDTVASFFKLTWAPTASDQVELSYNGDPTKDKSVGSASSIPSFDFDRETGGSRFAIKYDRDFGSVFHLTAKAYKTENKTDITPASAARRVDLIFPDDGAAYGVRSADEVPNYDKQFGGIGWYTNTTRSKEGFDIDGSWLMTNMAGEHAFKVGISMFTEGRKQKLNNGYGGDYENLVFGAGHHPTLGDVENDFTGASWADGYAPDSVLGPGYDAHTLPADLMAYLTSLPGADGAEKVRNIPMITPDPLGPAGSYLQYRIQGLRTGTATVKRKAQEAFLQDVWSINSHWSTTLGVRFNKDSYYADDGAKLHTTELNVAPRVAITYTPSGTTKLFATYGRYFEPIKLDMVNFAGSFANARTEQLWVGGSLNRWVDVRQRGGRETVDAMMAPTLQSPYTDEARLGFEKDLGKGWAFEATYTHRKDMRIVEDFDMLYTNSATVPNAGGLTPARLSAVLGNTPAYWEAYLRTLAIPLSHFGFTVAPSNVNYVLANLPGGQREFHIIDLTLRRNFTNGWQGMFSTTFTNANGNSLSSGDADFQGDSVRVDPRTPWMNGTLIGSIDHQFKGYLSYTIQDGTFKGLNFGATGVYLSGQHYTRGLGAYGRILQGPFISDFDPAPGTRVGPAYANLDMRVKYEWKFATKYKAEVFVDIFNLTNRQATTALEESSNGVSGYRFGEPIAWQAPRRFYLGARISF
ncbi:MAG: TonB-dependent receptor [Holophagaceae bacterium]|nr:TonB-dependent receptor [Holophagaceae bacterium]